MNNFVFIITVISLVFVIATVLLGRLAKRWPKYIPAVLAAAASVALFVKAKWYSEGFEGLAYAILLVITLIVFITSLIAAVIMEIIRIRKRRAVKGSEGPSNEGGTEGPSNEGGTGV